MNAKSTLDYSPDILDKYETFIKRDYNEIQTQIKITKRMKDNLQSYMNSSNRTTSSFQMPIPSEMIEHSTHYLEIFNLIINMNSLIPSNRIPNIQEKAQILQYMKQVMVINEQLPNPIRSNPTTTSFRNGNMKQVMAIEEQKLQQQLQQQLQQLELHSSELENQIKSIIDTIIVNPTIKSLVESLVEKQVQEMRESYKRPISLISPLIDKIYHEKSKITLYMRHLNELKLLINKSQITRVANITPVAMNYNNNYIKNYKK